MSSEGIQVLPGDPVEGGSGKMDAMYWLMPVGLVCGLLVVIVFERVSSSWRMSERKALFKSLTCREDWKELHPSLDEELEKKIDNVENVLHFWGGGALSYLKKDEYCKVYEMLALVSALMLSICVSFYTSSVKMDHVYGLICCIANCALWMSTLSSAFFCVALGSCEDDKQAQLLVGMYGKYLMRVPMILFVWGTSMLFLEFVWYFKLAVDPGFACSMCLTSCFVIVPLFFHCMHKLGWVGKIVKLERESSNQYPTAAQIQALVSGYISSKGDNCFALDFGELEALLGAQPQMKCTSTSLHYAKQLFEDHVQKRLAQLPSH